MLKLLAIDGSFMLSIEDTQQSDRPDGSNSLAERQPTQAIHIQRRQTHPHLHEELIHQTFCLRIYYITQQ